MKTASDEGRALLEADEPDITEVAEEAAEDAGAEPERGADAPEADAADAQADSDPDADSEPVDEEAVEEEGEGPPIDELSDEELERELAALLLASADALSTGRLAELCGRPKKSRVKAALGRLTERFLAAGLPYELREIAGGWQLYTAPEMADVVGRLAKVKKDEKVSPAALETLAIVAYRQPVTKAELEAIRGVQVGPIVRALVDRGLLKVAGRADVPGHPLLYATTKRFLDVFGLARIEDLPRDDELLRG